MSPMKLFSQGMLGKLGAKDETRKRYFSDETATDSELGNKAITQALICYFSNTPARLLDYL